MSAHDSFQSRDTYEKSGEDTGESPSWLVLRLPKRNSDDESAVWLDSDGQQAFLTRHPARTACVFRVVPLSVRRWQEVAGVETSAAGGQIWLAFQLECQVLDPNIQSHEPLSYSRCYFVLNHANEDFCCAACYPSVIGSLEVVGLNWTFIA